MKANLSDVRRAYAQVQASPVAVAAPPSDRPLPTISVVPHTARLHELSRAVLAILANSANPIDTAHALWVALPGQLGERAVEAAIFGADRLSHLKAVAEHALECKAVIDIEGCYYRKLFAPADLVVADGACTVLIDLTSDPSLRAQKMSALEVTCAALREAGHVCRAEVMVFQPAAIRLAAIERPTYTYTRCEYSALLAAKLRPDVAAEIYSRAVTAIAAEPIDPPRTRQLAESEIRLLQLMAREDDVQPAGLAIIQAHFPTVYDIASSALSSFSTKSRGIPSSITGRDLSCDDPWIAGAIVRLEACSTDEVIWLGEAQRSVGFRRKEGRSFTILHAELDEDIRMLDDRISGPETRAQPVAMSLEATSAAYRLAENAVYAGATSCRQTAGIASLAAEILSLESSDTQIGPEAANRVALRSIQILSTCTAGAALTATAEMAMAQMNGMAEKGPYWYQFFDGRSSAVIGKRTGSVSDRNVSSRIVVVADPSNFQTTWRSPVHSSASCFVSKVLLAQPRVDDWYSKAPGVVLTKLCAYQNDLDIAGTSPDDDESRLIAADLATAALCARKSDATRRKASRAIVLSNQSVISDLPTAAKKFAIGFHKYATEALATARTLFRAAAVSTLRLSGTLKHSIDTHYNRRKTSIATPVHARIGIANAALVLNSLYDGHIGPITSANFALSDAAATVELIKYNLELAAADASNQHLGMSSNTLANLLSGAGDEAFTGDGFIDDEVAYAVGRARAGSYIGGSIALVCAAADKLATGPNFERTSESAIRSAAKTKLNELMTLRKATADGEAAEARELRTALENIASLMRRLTLNLPKRLADLSLSDLAKLPGALASSSIAGLLCAVLRANLKDANYTLIAKEYSIEKARDIILLTASSRLVQAFCEKVTAGLCYANPGSAMSSEDKIAAMRTMRNDLSISNSYEFVMSVATDKSGYGPTMNTGMLAAIAERLPLPQFVVAVMRAAVELVSSKRILLSRRVMDLSEEDFWALPMDRGDLEALNRCRVQAGFRCASGMGQGILQRFADLKSGLASTFCADVLAKVGLRSCVKTTNDDGLISFVTTGRTAFRDTHIACIVAQRSYGAFGEKLNMAKLFASSYFAELNTCCLVHDEIIFPWARQAAACCNPCESPVLAESALHAMSIANAMVAEGAPAAACHLACGLAWACHYRIHRLHKQVREQEFIGGDPALFGKPVIRPFAVAAFGATAVRAHAIVASGVPAESAVSYIVESCLAGALDADAAVSWGDAEARISNYKRLTAVSTRTFNKPSRSRKIAQVSAIVSREDPAVDVLELECTVAAALVVATSGAATSTSLRARHGESVAYSAALSRLASEENRFSVRGIAGDKFVTSTASLSEVRLWAASAAQYEAPAATDELRELHRRLLNSIDQCAAAERAVSRPCVRTSSVLPQTARARPLHVPVDMRELAIVLGLSKGGFTPAEQRALAYRHGIHVYGAMLDDEPYLDMESRFARARMCLSRINGDGVKIVVSRAAASESLLSKLTVALGYHHNLFAGFKLVPDAHVNARAPPLAGRRDSELQQALTSATMRAIMEAASRQPVSRDASISIARVASTTADVVMAALQNGYLDFNHDAGMRLLSGPSATPMVVLGDGRAIRRAVNFGPSVGSAFRIRDVAGDNAARWFHFSRTMQPVELSFGGLTGPMSSPISVSRALQCVVAGIPAYACVVSAGVTFPIVRMPRAELPTDGMVSVEVEPVQTEAFSFHDVDDYKDAASCIAAYAASQGPNLANEFVSRCFLQSPIAAVRWLVLRWCSSARDFWSLTEHINKPALVAAVWGAVIRFAPIAARMTVASLHDNFTDAESAEPLAESDLARLTSAVPAQRVASDPERQLRDEAANELGVYFQQDDVPHDEDASEAVQRATDRRARADAALRVDEDVSAGLFLSQCVAALAVAEVTGYENRSPAVLGLADALNSHGRADRHNAHRYLTRNAMLVDLLGQSRYAAGVSSFRIFRMRESGAAFRLEVAGGVIVMLPDAARVSGFLGSGGTMSRIEMERMAVSARATINIGARSNAVHEFDLDTIMNIAIGADSSLNEEF